jgi:hypothetical protein
VRLDDGAAATLTGSGLQRVEVPVYTTALAATDHGVVAARADGPWWLLRAGEHPAQVTPDPPARGLVRTAVRTAGDNLVVVEWSTPPTRTDPDPGTGVLSVHDVATGDTAAAVPGDRADFAGAWVTDPARRLAVYGPALFDLTTGTGVLVDGLDPLVIAGDVYGEVGGDLARITPTGTVSRLDPRAQLPRAISDGHALVISGGALYALPPASPPASPAAATPRGRR